MSARVVVLGAEGEAALERLLEDDVWGIGRPDKAAIDEALIELRRLRSERVTLEAFSERLESLINDADAGLSATTPRTLLLAYRQGCRIRALACWREARWLASSSDWGDWHAAWYALADCLAFRAAARKP